MHKSKSHNKKGFSLIEILLALFVLIVGIVATLVLVANSVREIADSRESIVASSLAQEGAELVRNVRDNNASDVFHQQKRGLTVTREIFDGFAAGECRVESFVQSSSARIWLRCDGGAVSQSQARLRREVTMGQSLYRHRGAGAYSPYRRKIIIDNVHVSSGEIVRVDVISMVTWNDRAVPSSVGDCTTRTQCVADRTTLTDWIIHE